MLNHQKLREDFKKLIVRGRLSHAYLFFGGDRSVSENKVVFAKSLANFLENGSFEEPKRILTETLIIKKDEEGKIGIDTARSIRHFLYQKPVASKYRTLIVTDADTLTQEAKNSILKIVEEPPESALIIFIVSQEDNLSPALKSRLQKIYFAPQTHSPRKAKSRITSVGVDEAAENIDDFFEDLITDLMRDPVKNSKSLKAATLRLTLIKQWNTNKRLQLRALETLLGNR